MQDEEKFLKTIINALNDKKAQNIKVLKITEVSSIADYFVIASGTSITQLRALVDETEHKAEALGVRPKSVDRGVDWIVMDYLQVVVHIFNTETRDFYDLERLWQDGEDVDVSKYIN